MLTTGANSPRNITFKKQADIKTEYRMEISNEVCS